MGGQVIDKSLDRDAFTLAFSVLPKVLPNEMLTRPVLDATDFHALMS
jgi:hypothetical protein